MKLSTKTRYGVRALYDMAYHAGTLPVQVKDISRRQGISPRYLEQIFQDLKKADLLKSRRGPQGGYCLSRSPGEITLLEIVSATEGPLSLVECVQVEAAAQKKRRAEHGCDMELRCVTRTVWTEAARRLEEYLASVTLKDLCDEARNLGVERELDHRFMYFI